MMDLLVTPAQFDVYSRAIFTHRRSGSQYWGGMVTDSRMRTLCWYDICYCVDTLMISRLVKSIRKKLSRNFGLTTCQT